MYSLVQYMCPCSDQTCTDICTQLHSSYQSQYSTGNVNGKCYGCKRQPEERFTLRGITVVNLCTHHYLTRLALKCFFLNSCHHTNKHAEASAGTAAAEGGKRRAEKSWMLLFGAVLWLRIEWGGGSTGSPTLALSPCSCC